LLSVDWGDEYFDEGQLKRLIEKGVINL